MLLMQSVWPSLSNTYEPDLFEQRIYDFWEHQGYFQASDENELGQSAFCMVIPPPNVTGALHMGHALTNTLQDILVRWRRMCGDNTLWLPGTDHAGIATQAQVEKSIRPQSRHELGRSHFLKLTWEWKNRYGNQITKQLKRLGSSLDWKRERFTLDEGLSEAVREVFVRLYEEGWMYRGDRMIHWCPRCQTALSDLEVIPTPRQGFLWHLVYAVVDLHGNPVNTLGQPLQSGQKAAVLVVATTRPETVLGDTAIAIHPEDERYLQYHGLFVMVPRVGRRVPIVLDHDVDRTFGTGVLKVTPAHDFYDAELAQRHQLPSMTVIHTSGRMTEEAGCYAGLRVEEARQKIIEDFTQSNDLVRTQPHEHQVGLCQRCETVAEPLVSQQWFIKMAPLAEPAIEAVRSGRMIFKPQHWEKTYFDWMYQIRDWCVSRQLWWGHRIPAWYCQDCSAITVARQDPLSCCQCHSKRLKQDEDVLDTWFSSALWPFSTLGWPKQTQAFKTFYPTAILETGFDILFFWVARMVIMGLHFTGEVPFRRVYLHAMVRDEKGEKMSKSKGNVIDPLEIIDQHGADSLRLTLAMMAGQGRDIKLSVQRVVGYRAFCNKLWNAVKFFHKQCQTWEGGLLEPIEGLSVWLAQEKSRLNLESRWILSRLQQVIQTVHQSLESFEIHGATQALYEFTWYELCDWSIEWIKIIPTQTEEKKHALWTFGWILDQILKLWHPVIPFVTEELWQSLPWKSDMKQDASLMKQPFPTVSAHWIDFEAEKKMKTVQEIIHQIRQFRGENRLPFSVQLPVFAQAQTVSAQHWLQQFQEVIQKLACLRWIAEPASRDSDETVLKWTEPALEFRISLKGLVNLQEEEKRLMKMLEKTKADLEFLEKKLARADFLNKAPASLVERERCRHAELLLQKADYQRALKRLN